MSAAEIPLVPLLLSQAFIFLVPFLLGSLVGWLNPRTSMREWLLVWAVVCSTGWAFGAVAALWGVGHLTWWTWGLLNVVAVAADVQALRVRGKERKAARRRRSGEVPR